jgi:hypothetical protein
VAALIALVLGFSPKFGALLQAIPLAVMGGVSIVVFGLIAVAGAKIWVDNRVDFRDNANLIVAGVTLILGTGDFTLRFGSFALGGIGTRDLRRDRPQRPAAAARLSRPRRQLCVKVASRRGRDARKPSCTAANGRKKPSCPRPTPVPRAAPARGAGGAASLGPRCWRWPWASRRAWSCRPRPRPPRRPRRQ